MFTESNTVIKNIKFPSIQAQKILWQKKQAPWEETADFHFGKIW